MCPICDNGEAVAKNEEYWRNIFKSRYSYLVRYEYLLNDLNSFRNLLNSVNYCAQYVTSTCWSLWLADLEFWYEKLERYSDKLWKLLLRSFYSDHLDRYIILVVGVFVISQQERIIVAISTLLEKEIMIILSHCNFNNCAYTQSESLRLIWIATLRYQIINQSKTMFSRTIWIEWLNSHSKIRINYSHTILCDATALV